MNEWDDNDEICDVGTEAEEQLHNLWNAGRRLVETLADAYWADTNDALRFGHAISEFELALIDNKPREKV